MIIDYGDVSDELFAAYRMRGTLMCYHHHRANDNPYESPGEQDITAHVNFSELIYAARNLGFREIQYMTQKQFLIEAGIMDLLQEHSNRDPFSPEAKKNRSIRQLLMSDQMSELFKVLILEI